MNCQAIGLDYRSAYLDEYLEALEAHNAAYDPDAPKPASDTSGLTKFMKAHSETVQ